MSKTSKNNAESKADSLLNVFFPFEAMMTFQKEMTKATIDNMSETMSFGLEVTQSLRDTLSQSSKELMAHGKKNMELSQSMMADAIKQQHKVFEQANQQLSHLFSV